VNRINPDVSQQSFMRNLNMEPDYIPYSKDSSPGFDIAFGLKVD
jgi:hypothetical protein